MALRFERLAERICAAELVLAVLLTLTVIGSGVPSAWVPHRTPLEVKCDALGRKLPATDAERESATYCASLRAAEATEFQARMSAWSLGFVAITLLATAAAAIYTARQATLARRSLHQEHRPWLRIENIELTSGWTITPDEARISIALTVRNVGRTPARGVTLNPRIHIKWHVPAGEAQREAANALDAMPLHWGNTIFPDQTLRFQHGLTIGKSEWEAHFAEMNSMFPGSSGHEIFTLAVIGTVLYGTIFDKKRHHTGFAFEVRRAEYTDHHGGRSVAFGPNSGDVSQSDLTIHLPWSDVLVD
jgi:hypothetical protein